MNAMQQRLKLHAVLFTAASVRGSSVLYFKLFNVVLQAYITPVTILIDEFLNVTNRVLYI